MTTATAGRSAWADGAAASLSSSTNSRCIRRAASSPRICTPDALLAAVLETKKSPCGDTLPNYLSVRARHVMRGPSCFQTRYTTMIITKLSRDLVRCFRSTVRAKDGVLLRAEQTSTATTMATRSIANRFGKQGRAAGARNNRRSVHLASAATRTAATVTPRHLPPRTPHPHRAAPSATPLGIA